jgi:hypothetical protein
MTPDTIYQAIFQTGNLTVSIQYEPLENGLIFILQVDITERAGVTAFEDRRHKRRHGIVLSDDEQHTESLLPVTRREQLDFLK